VAVFDLLLVLVLPPSGNNIWVHCNQLGRRKMASNAMDGKEGPVFSWFRRATFYKR